MAQLTSTFTNAISTFGIGNTSSTIYATAHGGNTPVLNNFNDTSGVGIRNQFDGTNYGFHRYFFHFNGNSPATGLVIPGSATIVSAFLRLPGTNTTNNNVDTDTIGIYQSTVSTDTTIAITDWTNWGATLLGSLAFASYNNAANNDISLNASGMALISLTGGYTKLMVMSTKDHAATVPVGLNNETFNATGLILSVTYNVPDGLLTSDI